MLRVRVYVLDQPVLIADTEAVNLTDAELWQLVLSAIERVTNPHFPIRIDIDRGQSHGWQLNGASR